jgi:hypothetical protein
MNPGRLMATGLLHVFDRDSGDRGTWHLTNTLRPGDAAAQDLFGWDTAISDDLVVASSLFDDGNGLHNSGSAYVFYSMTSGSPRPVMRIIGNGKVIQNGSGVPSVSSGTAFASAQVGDAPVEHGFTIENRGPDALELTGSPAIAVTGEAAGSFRVAQPSAVTIPPLGGATGFAVSFVPSSVGTHAATIVIHSSDPNEDPYVFAIQGVAHASDTCIGRALYIPFVSSTSRDL